MDLTKPGSAAAASPSWKRFIAKSFSQNRERPKRSMLFVIFAAEEKGLLGSRYFAGRPTVPETEIVADLNLDMFMPLFPLKKLHVQGLVESTLAEDARAVGAAHNVEIATDPEPDRNSFTRTDQYSFVQAGVPALAMKFGWTKDSPEYKLLAAMARGSVITPQKTICRSLSTTRQQHSSTRFRAILRGAWPTAPTGLITSSQVSSTASKSKGCGSSGSTSVAAVGRC